MNEPVPAVPLLLTTAADGKLLNHHLVYSARLKSWLFNVQAWGLVFNHISSRRDDLIIAQQFIAGKGDT